MSKAIKVSKLKRLATKINTAHAAAETAARAAIAHALTAGRLLVEAKALCAHGTWGPWLARNFKGSERTAQAYMKLAKRWPEVEAKAQNSADLSIDAALKLLAAPGQVTSSERPETGESRAEFLERCGLGRTDTPPLEPGFRYSALVQLSDGPPAGPDDNWFLPEFGVALADITPSDEDPGLWYCAVYTNVARYTKTPVPAEDVPYMFSCLRDTVQRRGFHILLSWFAEPWTGRQPPTFVWWNHREELERAGQLPE